MVVEDRIINFQAPTTHKLPAHNFLIILSPPQFRYTQIKLTHIHSIFVFVQKHYNQARWPLPAPSRVQIYIISSRHKWCRNASQFSGPTTSAWDPRPGRRLLTLLPWMLDKILPAAIQLFCSLSIHANFAGGRNSKNMSLHNYNRARNNWQDMGGCNGSDPEREGRMGWAEWRRTGSEGQLWALNWELQMEGRFQRMWNYFKCLAIWRREMCR